MMSLRFCSGGSARQRAAAPRRDTAKARASRLALWPCAVIWLSSASGLFSADDPEALPAGADPAAPLAAPADTLISTNLFPPEKKARPATPERNWHLEIDTARQLRHSQDHAAATKMLVGILEDEPPPQYKKSALFELALVAQDEKRLARAQQILAQYLSLFPQDPTVPEVLLRQGLIFRQMGAQQMALAKYYAVMNAALSLKLDQFDYYKRLVLQAQTEIADTYYLQGKFSEAADFFGRILKQDAVELNRAQIQFKLIRCLASLGRHGEVVAQCETFFAKYPDAGEVPELRWLCANSFKQLGRSGDALAQVLKLLESQQATAHTNPENWAYWQQRAGNEIANQLYLEGDYLHALEIYQFLGKLDPSLAWQLPLQYQVGLIYERLRQPQKAADTFTSIIAREKELAAQGDNPTLKTVIEMARWRKDHINWQNRAELAVQSLHLGPTPVPPATPVAPSPSSTPSTPPSSHLAP